MRVWRCVSIFVLFCPHANLNRTVSNENTFLTSILVSFLVSLELYIIDIREDSVRLRRVW